MAGTGRLRSGTGTRRSQDAAAQDSQKLDAVLAAVEHIGDSLERARTSLEAKIDKVTSDLVLLHADHRNLADKTGAIEARVDELTPMASRLKSEMGDVLACLRIVAENKSHFFTTREAAWEWLESTGRASGRTAERSVPTSRNRCSQVRHGLKGGDVRTEAVAHAHDLEQLIQERREAIHSAAAISASPVESESETEISQPPSDRPTKPDRLSELGFARGPPLTSATFLGAAEVALADRSLMWPSVWSTELSGT
ncbi:hypothetical protein NDU88_005047 [Pleurodeles waltl]|uniref:Uncharacterized protein n=1 Tax=Pleurodeles waltl TaxID=8319 RepID=A0AAV7UGY6_PLEWA|nr:hypothetical protein NDU88_005047 [Pleurodeles waltl]